MDRHEGPAAQAQTGPSRREIGRSDRPRRRRGPARATTKRPRARRTLAGGENAVHPLPRRGRPGGGLARTARCRLGRVAVPGRAVDPGDRAAHRRAPQRRLPGGHHQRARSRRQPSVRRLRLRSTGPPPPPVARLHRAARTGPDAADAPRHRLRPAGRARRRRRRLRRLLEARRSRPRSGGPGHAALAHAGHARQAARGIRPVRPGRTGRLRATTGRPSRCAGLGFGARAAERRAALDAPARRAQRLRQHPGRQRAGAAALRARRLPAPAGRLVRARSGPLTLRGRTRTSRFARLAAAAAVVSLVASVSIASSAPAQTAGETGPAGSTTAPPEPTAGVSLVRQPAWIAPDGVEIMSLHLDNPELASNRDAEVEITVHSSVTSRTEFNRAVSGEELGGTLSRLTFPLTEAQLNPRDQFLVGFGLSGSDAQPQVGIDSPGVYPVEVGVIGTEADHSTFVTWMVVIDEQTASSSQPLRVSWIWQLGSPPLEQPSGGLDPERLEAMKPGGRLDELAKLLARAGDFPLTLGVGPEMLQGWAAAAHTEPGVQTGVARVRRAIQQPAVQLLPEPYVPLAGPTIEAEGLGEHLPDEYVEGFDTIDAVTGEIPDPRTALVDPIDEATDARLTQMLVGRFVVRDSALAPVPEARTPAQPFVLTTSSGSSTPAVASD